MMGADAQATRFQVIPRRVVHENVDGEVIAIHLDSGIYYSLRGSAAEIWTQLVARRSPEEVAKDLGARYEAPAAELGATVESLADELVAESLLEPCPNGEGPLDDFIPLEAVADRQPFETPSLEKFTEMQDFLLIDPIHEVAETGWPHADETASPGG